MGLIYLLLYEVKEEVDILHTVQLRKVIWIGHSLRWSSLLNRLIDVGTPTNTKNRSTEHSNQLIRDLFNPSDDRRLKRLWPEDLAQ
jgi:hypothetical protein